MLHHNFLTVEIVFENYKNYKQISTIYQLKINNTSDFASIIETWVKLIDMYVMFQMMEIKKNEVKEDMKDKILSNVLILSKLLNYLNKRIGIEHKYMECHVKVPNDLLSGAWVWSKYITQIETLPMKICETSGDSGHVD